MTIRRNPVRSVAKITRMSRGELWARGAQAITQRLDALRYRFGREPSVLIRGGRQPTAERFFFAPSEIPELIALLRNRLPAECEQIVERAERVRRGRFDLLGYEGLSFGEEIDWHLDPVSGTRSPFRPWYKVPYLDFARVGDSKVTWELNRHQHFVTLAKAYRLTGDKAYGDEIASQWHQWWASNPYPMGINWASALEVGFRSFSWLWVKHLLAGSPGLPQALSEDIDRGLALSGRHLETYLSTYFSANTHLLGEVVALFFIGVLMPGVEGSRRWRERAWEIILEQSRQQFLPDGLHFERSLYYHVYALDLLLHARILANLNGVHIPGQLDIALQRQLDVLSALSASGAVFRFGDDDGGRLFDGARNRAEHLLDPLPTGAALFGRQDLAAPAEGLREETVWLLGVEGVRCLDRMRPQGARFSSRSFPASEMYLMAADAPVPRHLLIGPGIRPGLSGGHAHADSLGLQMTLAGRPVLADSGTFVYVDAEGLRDRLRGTSAHNTVEVDGRSQAAPTGPFVWRTLPEFSTELWVSDADFDVFKGHHEGYSRPGVPLLHSRWVVNLKSGFVLVRDVVDGRGTARLDLRWHLAPEAELRETSECVHVALVGDDPVLAFLTTLDHGWSARVEQGWMSPVYGKRESRPVLHFSHQANLPTEFVTLLHPFSGGAEPAGVLRRLETRRPDGANGVAAYEYDATDASHFFFFSESELGWQFEDWKSDARFLYCTVDSARQKLSKAVVVQGSHVCFGRQRHTEPDPAGGCWIWQG